MYRDIAVLCGDAKFRYEIERSFALQGIATNPHARYSLLVDAPWGWVQTQLTDMDVCHTIILSNNPCPEYKLDLLEYRPVALFAHMSLVEIIEKLEDVWQGGSPDSQIRSPLTPTERFTLHLIAKGYTPKKIASTRSISEGRVKNTLSVIYQKLELNSRAQLALYYYGLWHILEAEGWKPLRHTRD